MSGLIRRIVVRGAALIALLVLAIAGCEGNDGIGPDEVPPATALRIEPAAPALRLGDQTTLTPVFTGADGLPANPPDGELTWSSSNPDVLTVDGAGVLRGVSVGEATIEARAATLMASAAASVLRPEQHTGDNAPVTRTIDQNGGAIEATGADGTHYSLRVPANAVEIPLDITLTPIDSIAAFPMRDGIHAAVSFEPAGLRFLQPAELTIVVDGGVGSNVGFTISDDFRLIPARVSGDTARLIITHFSSAGTGNGTDEELNALAELPTESPEDRALQEVAIAVAAGAGIDGAVAHDQIAASLRAWLNSDVIPDLAAASGDPLDDALVQYVNWLTAVDMWAEGLLDAEKAQARGAAAAALRAEIDSLNAQCAEQNDLEPLADIMQWVGRAEQLALTFHDESLSLEAVAASLCAQPVIMDATMPDTIEGSVTLDVRAGLSVGGRAPVFDPAVRVTLSSSAARFTPGAGDVDGSGLFSSSVELEEGSTRALIDVTASFPGFPVAEAKRTLTAEGRIRMGVRVDEGYETTVDPGGAVEVVASLTQGKGGMLGKMVMFELLGPGSLSSTEAMVTNADNGDAQPVIYTAPDTSGTASVIGRFRDGSFMVTDTATITIGGCTAAPPDFEYYGAPGVFVDARDGDGGGTVTSAVLAAEPHHLSYEAEITADESGNWISATGYLYVDDYIMIEALDAYTGYLTLHMAVYLRAEFTVDDETFDVDVSAANNLGSVGVDLEGRESDPLSSVLDTTVTVPLDDRALIDGRWIRMRHNANGYVRTRGGNRHGSVSVESRMDILDHATDSAGASIPIRVCSALGASY